MNYHNMTNAELLEAAFDCTFTAEGAENLIAELIMRFEPFADLDPDEPHNAAIRDELDKRFPELADDSELSGADTVDRLSEWYYEVAL